MRKGYIIKNYGNGTYVLVNNYKALNEIVNFVYTEPKYEVKKSNISIGMWKPKTIKNEQ